MKDDSLGSKEHGEDGDAAARGCVAITGTGLLSRALALRLAAAGRRVVVYTRSPGRLRPEDWPGIEARAWHVPSGPDEAGKMQLPADCEAVVSLAGESIDQRWSPKVKAALMQSRVQGTRLVVRAMAELPTPPPVLVSASGVSILGQGYLAEVCQAWEAEALKAKDARVVLLRIAPVLAREGGALAKLLPFFRMGLGGQLGRGQHYMPWIHIEDLVGMIEFALATPSVSGAVHCLAPEEVTGREFAQSLAAALHRPCFAHVPKFALRALLAEGADAVLESLRAQPTEALEAGFEFRYPKLAGALADLVA